MADDQPPLSSAPQELPPGMPAWVKYLLLGLVTLVVLVVVVMLLVGGDHGPGRHGGGKYSAPGQAGVTEPVGR